LIFSTYNRLWREAEGTIADLLTQEMPEEKPKPEKVCIFFFIIPVFTRIINQNQTIHYACCITLKHVTSWQCPSLCHSAKATQLPV